MRYKYKVLISMILFGILLLVVTDYSLKDPSIVKIDNIVKKSKEKSIIQSTPTLKVKMFGVDSNLRFKVDGKRKGVFELARKSMEASLHIQTEVIDYDSKEQADLFFGPEKIFDKSYFKVSKPIFTKQYIIYTTNFSKDKLEDFKLNQIAFHGYKLGNGYIEDNINRDIEEDIFSEYNLVKFDNEEHAVEGLHTNEFEAVISDQEIVELETNDKVKRIAVDHVLIDFVIAHRMREIDIELSNAIEEFTKRLYENHRYTDLSKKQTYEYYGEQFRDTLTEQEINWINANRNIFYTAPTDYAPYSSLIGDELSGITVNVMDSLSTVTGINFVFTKPNKGNNKGENYFDEIKNGAVKLVPFVGKYNNINEPILYTEPIFNGDLVAIGNQKGLYFNNIQSLDNRTLVITGDNFAIDDILQNTTNVTVIKTNSNEELFEQLKKNPDYVAVLDLLMLNHYIKRTGEENVNVVGRFEDQEYFIAVEYKSPELVSILNRAIKLIDVERYANNYTITASSPMIYRNWIIPIFIIFGIIILLLFYLQKIVKDLNASKTVKNDIQMMNVEYDHILGQILEIFEMASLVTQEGMDSHTKRLITYCEILGAEYGLDKELIGEISHYVPLHDIGNIGVNNDLFTKSGDLTEEDKEELRRHVIVGTELVDKMNFGQVAKNIVQYHHERWDGKGYHEGLKELEIPIEARIVNLADTYDVLRMKRPYKRAFTHKEALYEILDERGKQFEPRLVDIFVKYNKIFESCYDTSVELIKKLRK